ncbi:acyl-ACP thioesterase [Pyruvatibacter sp.]|uniref:acyl-ACP thioesterase n=1 Tax=Pyruvatibacter sp. TaxID=1981328 RepID=UPI0032EB851C
MTILAPLLRSSVQTWECDDMGHMNVQFYVAKANEGLDVLAHHLGFGPTQARTPGNGAGTAGAILLPREHHIRFHREQRPGAPLTLEGSVTGREGDTLKVYEELTNTASGVVAATINADVVLADAATRARLALPGVMDEAIDNMMTDVPPHGQARGLEMGPAVDAPALAQADDMGLVYTWQGVVKPAQCDMHGFMLQQHFMGLVSDSIPNLLSQTRGDDRSSDPNIGGAALEYRFVYRQWPRVGDILTLRSGLKHVGPKTYTWAHWMFDVETGKAVATAEAVAVTLDLVARRAIGIPDAMRAHLESKLVPGIGA